MATSKVTSGCTALTPALEPFASASLELLARRKLLKRAVSKFLFPVDALDTVFSGLEDRYRILPAGTGGVAAYRTLYFDTPDLQCFHDHRRGRRLRQKVRIRTYPDRRLSFLEVKSRRSSFEASKHRLELPYGEERLGAEARAFVSENCRFPTDDLVQTVRITFDRVTLLGIDDAERITLDVDLGLERGDYQEQIGGIAILEVKQRSFSGNSPIMRALRQAGLRPLSMSKYCTALALTRDDLRKNRFLPTLRTLQRMRT